MGGKVDLKFNEETTHLIHYVEVNAYVLLEYFNKKNNLLTMFSVMIAKDLLITLLLARLSSNCCYHEIYSILAFLKYSEMCKMCMLKAKNNRQRIQNFIFKVHSHITSICYREEIMK